MIKTYVYTKPMNNVSHVITGQGGNTVRFNFVGGNVITKKLAEITLHGSYYQDLLESSDIFKKGLVRLVRKIPEPSDLAQQEAKQTTETEPSASDVIEVASVVSESDIIAFANEKDHREGLRSFRTVSSALAWCTEHNYSFPNYKP